MNANTIKGNGMGKAAGAEPDDRPRAVSGSQTLVRGLVIIEAVASGMGTLNEIAVAAGLARSTAYRLASTLVEHGYLSVAPRDTNRGGGYRLGEKLSRLSQQAVRTAGQ